MGVGFFSKYDKKEAERDLSLKQIHETVSHCS